MRLQQTAVEMSGSDDTIGEKKLILIRHGCTHMNEYLESHGSRWGDPYFTDVFDDSKLLLYKDSMLSQKGIDQAKKLHDYFHCEGRHLLENVELIAVSPLKRTLQTLEIAITPHLTKANDGIKPKMIALPLASERLYLVSDIGSDLHHLRQSYPFVDFSTEFKCFGDEWWFRVKDERNDTLKNRHEFSYMHVDDYKEWRPSEENQVYFCHGEPENAFSDRMRELLNWLENREEHVIMLICHWGVLAHLTGKEFANCEVQTITLREIRSVVNSKSK